MTCDIDDVFMERFTSFVVRQDKHGPFNRVVDGVTEWYIFTTKYPIDYTTVCLIEHTITGSDGVNWTDEYAIELGKRTKTNDVMDQLRYKMIRDEFATGKRVLPDWDDLRKFIVDYFGDVE